MDPNETLAQIRNLSFRLRGGEASDGRLANELAAAVHALDEWLLKGGLLPKAWER
jgi:hypothetical protein